MENENKAQEIVDEIVENLEKESNEDFVDILTEVISKLNDQVGAAHHFGNHIQDDEGMAEYRHMKAEGWAN